MDGLLRGMERGGSNESCITYLKVQEIMKTYVSLTLRTRFPMMSAYPRHVPLELSPPCLPTPKMAPALESTFLSPERKPAPRHRIINEKTCSIYPQQNSIYICVSQHSHSDHTCASTTRPVGSSQTDSSSSALYQYSLPETGQIFRSHPLTVCGV